jgi:hypothetical protein
VLNFSTPTVFRATANAGTCDTTNVDVDGLSLNHFISLAIVEKVTRMDQQSRVRQQARGKQYSVVASRFELNKLRGSEPPLNSASTARSIRQMG